MPSLLQIFHSFDSFATYPYLRKSQNKATAAIDERLALEASIERTFTYEQKQLT